jgi:molecular chaperone IbpA
MTRLTSLDLTPFYRNAVGFDSLFDRMTANIDMAASSGGQNYPPYDIIRTGDETYRIQIAVAGFQLADIKIELENGTLNITGHQYKPDVSKEDGGQLANNEEYLHRGISNRNFHRSFNLADYVEVKGATIKDGILKIELERVIPEVMKPKTIEIKHES